MFDNVGILGVGMIGASLGLTLKSRRLCRHVLGVGRRQTSLNLALQVEAVDEAHVGIDERLSDLDLLVICTPVDRIAAHARQAKEFLPSTAVITDAGSTKARLVKEIGESSTAPFVGSHPIAGSEKTGPLAGVVDLFAGKPCVVTPTAHTDQQALERVKDFWRRLDMNVFEMSPQDHDRTLARTSHLPHLVATVLASLVGDDERPFAGTGVRDTTRIAAGDPELWCAIVDQNREACLEAIGEFENGISTLRRAIESNDTQTLRKLLADGKKHRDSLGN